MSEYRGYCCDKCGTVMTREQRTRRTVRVEGPALNGEYDEDLCGACLVVPSDVTMRPLRRRTPRTEGAPAPAQDAAPAAPAGG